MKSHQTAPAGVLQSALISRQCLPVYVNQLLDSRWHLLVYINPLLVNQLLVNRLLDSCLCLLVYANQLLDSRWNLLVYVNQLLDSRRAQLVNVNQLLDRKWHLLVCQPAPRQQPVSAGMLQSALGQKMASDGICQPAPRQQTVPSGVISFIPWARAAPSNTPRLYLHLHFTQERNDSYLACQV